MGDTQFLIAGGGIAGLSAAIAVTSQPQQRVTLIERSPAFLEIGAGLQLSPNAWRCLRQWGLEDALRRICSLPDALLARSMQSGATLGRIRLAEAAVARYGAPYGTALRADLHQLLLERAHRCERFSLSMGTQVTALQPGDGSVTVQVGSAAGTSTLTADAVLAADGVRSQLHASASPQAPVAPSPYVAYRGIIRLSALPQRLRSNSVCAWLGRRMHAVTYPVGGEWLNVVLVVTTTLLEHRPQRGPANIEAVLASATRRQAIHADLHDLVLAIGAHGHVSAGARWTEWPLLARAPVQSPRDLAHGRVALLGDAAHPMMPFLAQGAAMAIEDAEQLRLSLAQQTGQVEAALAHFAQARHARNAKVQRRALRNGRIFHMGGLMAWSRDLTMKAMAAQVMDQPWLYGGGPAPVAPAPAQQHEAA